MMFETIGLAIGKVEKDALKARNKMAHSSMGEIDDREIAETLRYSQAYETLFNRIFLKLLGYDGDYIDYFTPGYPHRHIAASILVA
jgi:hypothetical protein